MPALKYMKAVVFDGEKASVQDNVAVPQIKDPKDMLIKVKAVAGNPFDWKAIDYKLGGVDSIVGCDLSGDIVAVGSEVDLNRFNIGDKVTSTVYSCSVTDPDNGAFAEYATVSSYFAIKINNCTTFSSTSDESYIKPGLLLNTYEGAASFPGVLYTAALISVWNFNNKLEFFESSDKIGTSAQNNFPLLIWGGATALGQYMIQIAKKTRAYSKIIVVASKKHESLLKSFGADELFDYHDSNVVEQITSKYPNLIHLLDTVSNKATFNQTYQLASKIKKSIFVNVTNLSINDIEQNDAKQHPSLKNESVINENVKISTIAALGIFGKEVHFGEVVLPVDELFVKSAQETIPKLQDPVNNGTLTTIPIKIYHKMDSILKMVDDIRKGLNSGEKYVCTL